MTPIENSAGNKLPPRANGITNSSINNLIIDSIIDGIILAGIALGEGRPITCSAAIRTALTFVANCILVEEIRTHLQTDTIRQVDIETVD